MRLPCYRDDELFILMRNRSSQRDRQRVGMHSRFVGRRIGYPSVESFIPGATCSSQRRTRPVAPYCVHRGGIDDALQCIRNSPDDISFIAGAGHLSEPQIAFPRAIRGAFARSLASSGSDIPGTLPPSQWAVTRQQRKFLTLQRAIGFAAMPLGFASK